MVLDVLDFNNPMELASKIEKYINTIAVNARRKEFLSSLKESSLEVKENFTLLGLLWVYKMKNKYDNNLYDLRNEYSVKVCKRIHELINGKVDEHIMGYKGEFRSFKSDAEIPVHFLIVEELGNMHRTLQQVFTSFVLAWFKELVADGVDILGLLNILTEVDRVLTEEYGEFYYEISLI